jgi:hypothetical protein
MKTFMNNNGEVKNFEQIIRDVRTKLKTAKK